MECYASGTAAFNTEVVLILIPRWRHNEAVQETQKMINFFWQPRGLFTQLILDKTICLEAPESMMKLGEIDVLATKACTLSLSSEIDPPSLFFEQSGREMLFFSKSWSTCQFASSYKTSQDDSPYCSMHTFSFLLCSSSSWNLGDPLETCSCLSFA